MATTQVRSARRSSPTVYASCLYSSHGKATSDRRGNRFMDCQHGYTILKPPGRKKVRIRIRTRTLVHFGTTGQKLSDSRSTDKKFTRRTYTILSSNLQSRSPIRPRQANVPAFFALVSLSLHHPRFGQSLLFGLFLDGCNRLVCGESDGPDD